MKVDNNFFKWLAFAMRIIKLMIEMFGDPDEQEEAKNNKVEI